MKQHTNAEMLHILTTHYRVTIHPIITAEGCRNGKKDDHGHAHQESLFSKNTMNTTSSLAKQCNTTPHNLHPKHTNEEEEVDLFPEQQGHGKLPLPLQAGQVVGLLLPSKENILSFKVPRALHLTHGILVTPPHSIHNFKSLQSQNNHIHNINNHPILEFRNPSPVSSTRYRHE